MPTPLEQLSSDLDADVILLSGAIYPPLDDTLISEIRLKQTRENVFLVLVTNGGFPDAGYRVARALQRSYTGRFTLFIPAECKSTGTLIALGADEIVMSDSGQLGPLDMQIRSREDFLESSSGMTPLQALESMRQETRECFFDHFRQLVTTFPSKMAADISVQLTVGLFSSIYQQIDPIRFGENQRAVNISLHYGLRLAVRRNVKESAVQRLVAGYPSHGFVIDREEAQELFMNVRKSTDLEEDLVTYLRPDIEQGRELARGRGLAILKFLTPAQNENANASNGDESNESAIHAGNGSDSENGNEQSVGAGQKTDEGNGCNCAAGAQAV